MKFRFSKKKKYKEHASSKEKQLYIDDAGTQCGSQVPLVNQGKYSDYASVCGTASMSPSGSNSTVSLGTPDSKNDDARKKNSLFCIGNRARTRSSGKKRVPFDERSMEESWPASWQDCGSPPRPSRPEHNGALPLAMSLSESPISIASREQLNYPNRPIPVSRSFPFDEGGDDLVSSWINDSDSTTDGGTATTGPSVRSGYDNATASGTEDESTDAATGTTSNPMDDGSSTLSTRGTGSIYTYGTGFSRFSGDTGLDSYGSSTTFNGLKLVDQNSLAQSSAASNSLAQSSAASTTNSLAYSQSSVSATNEGFSLLDEIQEPGTTNVIKRQPSAAPIEPSLDSYEESFSLEEDTDNEEPQEAVVKEERRTENQAQKTSLEVKRRKKKPSVRDVFSDIGMLAGEIFVDVRDSVSCAVDTTRDTVKGFNYEGTPCFSGDFKSGTHS